MRIDPRALLSGLRAPEARRFLLPAVLALLVIAVLSDGARRRRSLASPRPPQTVPTPSPVPAMRPDLEKTPLGYEAEFFFQLGSRARGGLVALGSEGATGVLVEKGLAVTSLAAADRIAQEPGSLRVLGADGRLGLAAVAVAEGEGPSPLRPADLAKLHPGSYLAAVSVGPEAGFRVVPGYLASARRERMAGAQLLDLALPPSAAASPLAAVVTLDRDLAGLAVRGPEGMHVFSVESALSVARALAQGRPCHALEVAGLPGPARQALRLKEGVVVEKIWASAFRGESAIRPGDVLLAWDESKLDSPEAFRRAYDGSEPGRLVRYAVWREGRRQAGWLEQPGRDCRPAAAARRQDLLALGASLRWSPGSAERGLLVLTAPPGTPAAAAGLAEQDLILAVDGRRLGWPSARRVLPSGSPARPLVLTVRRRDRVSLLVVPPSGP